jgi:hypothetical protein
VVCTCRLFFSTGAPSEIYHVTTTASVQALAVSILIIEDDADTANSPTRIATAESDCGAYVTAPPRPVT